MSSPSTGIAAVWPFVRADTTSGRWTRSRDRHLVRLRAAFADPNARSLVADAPPCLSDMLRDVLLGLWRRTFEEALPIARIGRGQRIKITTLLAVRREARADGPVRDLVESFARDLMEREAMEDVDDPRLSDCVAAAWDGGGG
jgi:hypothetical protein